MSTRTLYDLLDSRREASPAELRHDYERALAAANRTGATKRMVEIVHAYEVLSNPHYRAYYDETGRAVRQERVPNTFGRQVPFRAGPPVLGAGTVLSANPCQPPAQRFGLSTPRGRWLVVIVFVVAASASAVAALAARGHGTAHSAIVPGAPGVTVQVVCQRSTYWAAAGTTVTCPDGAAPRWGARRVR